jgi:hypothetical protein
MKRPCPTRPDPPAARMSDDAASYLTREAQARVQIDEMLAKAGWIVQDARKSTSPRAAGSQSASLSSDRRMAALTTSCSSTARPPVHRGQAVGRDPHWRRVAVGEVPRWASGLGRGCAGGRTAVRLPVDWHRDAGPRLRGEAQAQAVRRRRAGKPRPRCSRRSVPRRAAARPRLRRRAVSPPVWRRRRCHGWSSRVACGASRPVAKRSSTRPTVGQRLRQPPPRDRRRRRRRPRPRRRRHLPSPPSIADRRTKERTPV